MTETLLLKYKCCNFRPNAFGGYSFIFVCLKEINGVGFPYKFNADAISLDANGKFDGGAILTYSPHKTLADAELRWEELGLAFVEHQGSTGDESSIDMLARLALVKYRTSGQGAPDPDNIWWVN